ncbi:MAG: RNase adapter RapZ [Gammaproteobacteria bacterium]|nr:RNase adapter RapZ [Gammaproteobacteria bacterium]
MKLVIVSGLSGSGKTVALHTLEDEDYYCVDNLPLGLLPDFVERVSNRTLQPYTNIAVGIDARSEANDLRNFNNIIKPLRERDIEFEIIYLQAELNTLIKRFSDTRRKHPLTTKGLPLSEAIEVERVLLSTVSSEADLFIDTTYTNIHQLRDQIKKQIVKNNGAKLSLLFQSFGFKHGTPTDSDFVFDVRCLPNPHWESNLRPLTGLDKEVASFLQSQDEVQDMLKHIRQFMQDWIPKFEKQNRHYLTVSIGCTGGQHRSVFIAQQLCDDFNELIDNVSVRHREMQ